MEKDCEIMCTEEKFHALEHRVSKIEEEISDLRCSIENGFKNVNDQLDILIDERKQWSAWLRGAIGKTIQVAFIIILCACGINQISKVAAIIKGVPVSESTNNR